MKARTLVVLLDADGCFYNNKFQQLLLWVICHHGDFIKDLVVNYHGASCSPEKQIELQSKFDAIKNEVKNLKLHERDFAELKKETIKKFWPENKVQASGEVSRFIVDLYNEYISFLDEIDRKFLDGLLCNANQHLIEKIQRSVLQNNVEKLIFMVGSNRQSMELDQHNKYSKGTRSFFQDLEMFVGEMQRVFSSNSNVHVSLDKFLMADIYNHLEPGESYKRILAELNNCEVIKQSKTVFDSTKLSTIYAFMHYLAVTHKDEYENGLLSVEYYDDTISILSALDDAFNRNNNQDLLPKNLPLSMYQYEGKSLYDDVKTRVDGSGHVDYLYRDNIRKMLEMCPRLNPKVSVDVANQLNFPEFRKARINIVPKADVSVSETSSGFFAMKPVNKLIDTVESVAMELLSENAP